VVWSGISREIVVWRGISREISRGRLIQVGRKWEPILPIADQAESRLVDHDDKHATPAGGP
jgi:hypothetical protein